MNFKGTQSYSAMAAVEEEQIHNVLRHLSCYLFLGVFVILYFITSIFGHIAAYHPGIIGTGSDNPDF